MVIVLKCKLECPNFDMYVFVEVYSSTILFMLHSPSCQNGTSLGIVQLDTYIHICKAQGSCSGTKNHISFMIIKI